MVDVPADYRDLFETDAFGILVTLMAEGMPHPTPVWVDYDPGEDPIEPWERSGEPTILVNTAEGRQKHVNVRRDPRVAGTIIDPEDPYRYFSFQGEVVAQQNDGAVPHIDALANRYMGVETYPNHGDESGNRMILRIELENVLTG